MLAAIGQKFSTRPSKLLGLLDDAVAFDFDHAAAMRLDQFECERADSERLKLAATIAALISGQEIPEF